MLGHRVLPVVGLCPGYRHVSLRTEANQLLPLATLFLLIVVKDYVPDGLSDFAEALANPIKYQSEQEKRAQQLSVFIDDADVDGEVNTEVDFLDYNVVNGQFGYGKIKKLSVKKLFICAKDYCSFFEDVT